MTAPPHHDHLNRMLESGRILRHRLRHIQRKLVLATAPVAGDGLVARAADPLFH